MDKNEHNELTLVDLIYISCCATGRFFKKCGCAVLRLIRFSLQHFWVVAACTILAGVAGFFLTMPKFTTYRGDATIYCMEEALPIVTSYIERIDLYSRSKTMAKQLQQPDSPQCKISKIECFNWIDFKHDNTPDLIDFKRDKSYLTDTSNVIMNDRLYLRIEANGVYDMNDIQAWLTNYFDQQPELTTATERGRQTLRENIATYSREIERLDSLSNFDYFERGLTAEIKNGIMLQSNKRLYFNDMFELVQKRAHLEDKLNRCTHNVTFQNDLIVTSAKSRTMRFALWLIAGYILGLLIALGLQYRTKIVAWLKETNN